MPAQGGVLARQSDMQDSGSSLRRASPPCLSPEKLARDFGASADVTRESIRSLYRLLAVEGQNAAPAPVDRWKRLVSGACGHDVDRSSAVAGTLAECYGVPLDRLRPAEMLFAVHTYYAVLVKLLVAEILASVHTLPRPSEQISSATFTSQLKAQLQRLEAGPLFRTADLVDRLGDDPYAWYLAAWNDSIERMIRRLADRFLRYDPKTLLHDPARRGDLLKDLYGDLFPRQVRHMLGEYYTPDWLARQVLDEVGYAGRPDVRLLDPACGSGTFLVMAVHRIRAWHRDHANAARSSEAELCRKILGGVVGFDLNPLAVLSARANYLIAMCDLLRHAGPVEIPVYLRDSILADPQDAGPAGDRFDCRFDCVVGNPPWIAWDDLPDDYREATKPLWQRYGLFSLSGTDARHGGGKKDLSMLMLYAAADRYLNHRGRLSMVITQTLFQTKGAGDGFRRFRLGDHGPWLRVLRVNDLADFFPFPGAANWTATIALEKGSRTAYPVPYVRWSCPVKRLENGYDPTGDLQPRRYLAEPIDPGRPTSPWLLRPEGLEADLSRLVGPSDYHAHLGANTGGANGVYWLTVLEKVDGGVLVRNIPGRGKRACPTVEQVIEPDLLYPLIRWADVARYRAAPSAHLLLAQDVDTRKGIDEATMRRQYPRTRAYLAQFASLLAGRAAYKRYQERAAFWSMYNVGRYTVAPIKVVWRRMDRRINAAVVEPIDDPVLGPRPLIPQETCVLVATASADEAHYLCALLNSSIVNFLVTSHSVRGGKGFGTPSMLDFLRLRRFDPANPTHAELAALSRQAHQAAQQGKDFTDTQHEIDGLAGRLWGLAETEVEVIRREMHGHEIPRGQSSRSARVS